MTIEGHNIALTGALICAVWIAVSLIALVRAQTVERRDVAISSAAGFTAMLLVWVYLI